MSEIRVTTLKDTSGGNSSSTSDIYSGRAKNWVNFNGTGTVAIRSSFNTNSITDLSAGRYTINIANALADGNYSCTGTSSYFTGDQIGWDVNLGDLGTTSYTMTCTNTLNGARADGEIQSCACFR
jgi:hypothetical protein